MNTLLKYILATPSSVGYAFAYLTWGLSDWKGRDLDFANAGFLFIGFLLIGINLLYFIPSRWVKIKYLLPGIVTLTLLLILLVYSEFLIDDSFGLVYVPFIINALWGGLFYFLEINTVNS